MNLEKTLTDELHAVGSAVQAPPPPDTAQLVRRATRARTSARVRTAATVVLAVAVVLGAIVLGNQLGKPNAAPSPGPITNGPTPTGEPLRTWVDQDGNFLIDGVRVSGDSWAGAVTSGDLTTAEQGPYDTGEIGVFIGAELVGMIHGVAVNEIPVSPDHRTIAWVEFGKDVRTKGTIVVGRVSADGVQELGRLQVYGLVSSGEVLAQGRLVSVADDGTVLYGGLAGGHSWKPGGQPEPADISAYEYNRTERHRGSDLHLSPTRTRGAWLADVANPEDPPEDQVFTAVVIQKLGEPDSQVKISFADQYEYVNIAAWESDTDLVVYAGHRGDPGTGRYLRCDAVTLACEYAPEPS